MSESKKIADSNFSTGAVRSADVSHLDFASLPLLGLLAVMRVAGGGGTKYGRFNYMKGMPLHETLNHIAVHLIRYCLGDRTEPHLAKVAWGAMVAEQTAVLNPELSEPHMLGPGATLTAELLAEMDRCKPERDARRQAGEFEGLFSWALADMPEVREILRQRLNSIPAVVMRNPTKEEMARFKEFLLKSPTHEIHIKGRGDVQVDDEGFIVLPEKRDSYADRQDREAIKAAARELDAQEFHVDPEGSHPLDHKYRASNRDPAHETLAEWCRRNPMAADAIQAKVLGLSGTGCPEPFGTLPKKTTPASQGGDHMGGCPPLP